MTDMTRNSQTTFNAVFTWRSLKTRVTLFTLIIFLVGIWSLAFYASYTLQRDMEHLLSDQQFSTVSMIASDINDELGDRLTSLEKIAARITPALLGNAASLQKFLESHISFQSLFNSGGNALRLDGVSIAETPIAGRVGNNYGDKPWIIEALKGIPTIGEPVMGKTLHAPVFSMATPIKDVRGKVIGVLTGTNDLSKPNFLSKITDNRYGKTGGYLLVSPKLRTIVYATDKKRIMEVLPAPGKNYLIDRFVQGHEESGIVVSPTGIEVLSSAKGIPVSGWYVAALMSTKEAFAPVQTLQKRVLFAAMFLTLLAGCLTWWMLKRQLAPVFSTIKALATLSATDVSPHPLPITTKDEIGELIAGFNRLLESLKLRSEALEVSEETARGLAQENELVAEIGRIINSTLDIEEVYERFAEKVREVISFDRIAVNTVNLEDYTRTIQYVLSATTSWTKKGAMTS